MERTVMTRKEYDKLSEDERIKYWSDVKAWKSDENEASISNIIRKKYLEKSQVEMRLYGIYEHYFETIDELFEFCSENDYTTETLTVLDYYRDYDGYLDVVKKSTCKRRIFYSAHDSYSYYWYSKDVEMENDEWAYKEGQIRNLYKPFKEHGIVFENDVYAKSDEENDLYAKIMFENKIYK